MASTEDRLYYCVADLHALTEPQNSQHLERWRNETLASLLAIGLDPARCNIFFQSAVPEHAELMWLLSCIAPVGYLARMTQWKSKSASTAQFSSKTDDDVFGASKLGLFSYPVLQAADVLLYGSTHVPVGIDQTQHLEFTRDIAAKFNAAYGQIFTVPHTILSSTARVMSLRNPHAKMSKSDPDVRSRILINDNADTIASKISNALTDSLPEIAYDAARRPGISNLLILMSSFDPGRRSLESLVEECRWLSKRAFKERVSSAIDSYLEPVRERYQQLINGNEMRSALDKGTAEARKQAKSMMNKVRHSMGLA